MPGNIGRGNLSVYFRTIDDATFVVVSPVRRNSLSKKNPVITLVNRVSVIIERHLASSIKDADAISVAEFYLHSYPRILPELNGFKSVVSDVRAVQGAVKLLAFPDSAPKRTDFFFRRGKSGKSNCSSVSLQDILIRLKLLDSSSLDDLIEINETGTFDHLGQRKN